MYIEASYPRRLGDYAELISPPLPFRGRVCLAFYYHMYGATIGILTVTLNGRTLFRKSGNQGNIWLKAEINTLAFGMQKVGQSIRKVPREVVSRWRIRLYLLKLATILNWP